MKKFVLVFSAIALVAACASTRGPMAMATMQSTSGSNVTGTVHMQQARDGAVEVKIDLTGVPPGVHGFHIHEKGDCGDNGNAAGPHFNPTMMPHAAPTAASHHAGDFGNVTAEANGEIHTTFTTRSITLNGTNAAVGHAVILHADPDDLTTQPSGNAGPRIACGVVTLQDANAKR